jgi:hypothetical protein
MWSGLHLNGVAIRDIHSLRRVKRGDRWGLPVGEGANREFERFGMPCELPITCSEIGDYLMRDGRYWRLRRAWHTPITLLHAHVDNVVIAHESTIAGPYDYEGLVPDALNNGYVSLGSHVREPKIQRLPSEMSHEPRIDP